MIHVGFPGTLGRLIVKLCSFAVPIFYLISGYYAYDCDESTIKNRLIKILKLLLYGLIVWTADSIFLGKGYLDFASWIKTYFGKTQIIKILVFCTIEYAIPLWFLIALAETYLFWIFVLKLKIEWLFIRLIPMLLLFYLGITIYCDTMRIEWFWKINFVAQALPWYMLGYYVNTKEGKWLLRIREKSLILSCVLGMILSILPIIFNSRIMFSNIGCIPYALSMFILMLRSSSYRRCEIIEYIGEKLSMDMYILHVIVAGLLTIMIRKIFKIDTASNMIFLYLRPIIGILGAVSMSYAVSSVREKYFKHKQ